MKDECENGIHCPDSNPDNTPVTERLCASRRETIYQTIEAEVKSIKNAVYLSSLMIAVMVAVIEIIFRSIGK